jgi:hypothetical protein
LACGNAPALLAVLSKSPMPAVSKALALEYAPNNIRFNTVSPGVINTPMHGKDNHAALAKFHPFSRMGEVSDVVDAILYLQNATFVTVCPIIRLPGRRRPHRVWRAQLADRHKTEQQVSLWRVLWAELEPFPGRDLATFRMAIACTAIVLLSNTFRLPFQDVLPFFALFTAKEERITTAITAVLTQLAITVSVGLPSSSSNVPATAPNSGSPVWRLRFSWTEAGPIHLLKLLKLSLRETPRLRQRRKELTRSIVALDKIAKLTFSYSSRLLNSGGTASISSSEKALLKRVAEAAEYFEREFADGFVPSGTGGTSARLRRAQSSRSVESARPQPSRSTGTSQVTSAAPTLAEAESTLEDLVAPPARNIWPSGLYTVNSQGYDSAELKAVALDIRNKAPEIYGLAIKSWTYFNAFGQAPPQ